jgi:hypothetical protein
MTSTNSSTSASLSERLKQARSNRRSSFNSNSTVNNDNSVRAKTEPPVVVVVDGNLLNPDLPLNTSTVMGATRNRGDVASLSQRYKGLPGISSNVRGDDVVASTTSTKSSDVLGRYRPNSSTTTTNTVTQRQNDAKSSAGSQISNGTVSSGGVSSSASTARSWRNIHALVQKIDETIESDNQYSEVTQDKIQRNRNKYTMPSVDSTSGSMNSANVNAAISSSQSWKYRNLHKTLSSKDSKDSTTSSATSNSTQQSSDVLPDPIPTMVVQQSNSATSSKTADSTSTSGPASNFASRWNNRYAPGSSKSTGIVTGPDKTQFVKRSEARSETTARAVVGGTSHSHKFASALQPSNPDSSLVSKPTPAAPHSYLPVAQYSFVPSPTNDLKKSPKGDEHSTITPSLGTSHSFASQSTRRSLSPPKSSPPHVLSVSASQYDEKPVVNIAADPFAISSSRSFGSPQKSRSPLDVSAAPSWKSRTNNSTVSKNKSQQDDTATVHSTIPAWKKKLQEQRKLQEEQRQQQEKVQSAAKWKKKAVVASISSSVTTAGDIVSSPSDEARVDVTNPVSTVMMNATTAVDTTATEIPSSSSQQILPSRSNQWPPQQYQQKVDVRTAYSRSRSHFGVGADQPTIAGNDRGGGVATSTTIASNENKTIVKPTTLVETIHHNSSSKAWFARTHPSPVGPDTTANSNSRNAPPKLHPETKRDNDLYPSISLTDGLHSEDTFSIPSPDKDDPAEQLGMGENITSVSPQILRRRGDFSELDPTTIPTSNPVAAAIGWESPRTVRMKAKESNSSPTYPLRSSDTATAKIPVAIPINVKSPDWTKSNDRQSSKVAPQNHSSTLICNEATAESDIQNDPSAKLVDASQTAASEATGKDKVAEMKAKLWGNGKSEKLVVQPKTVANQFRTNEPAPESCTADIGGGPGTAFGSPVRAPGNVGTFYSPSTATPPKHSTSKVSVVSPLLPKSTRGRPDVCTPNGPLPPPRSGGHGSQQHDQPPRRNMDTLWMKRIEQAAKNDEYVVSSPPRTKDAAVCELNNEEFISPMNNKSTLNEPNGQKDEFSRDEKLQADFYPNVDNEIESTVLSSDSFPPPPLLEQVHHRSPSIGDFQIASNPGIKIVVEDVSYESKESPPVSPRVARGTDPISPKIRPAVMPKWDSPTQQSDSLSPTSRRVMPPKLPPTSPATIEKKEKPCFSETIDCPPLDEAEFKWGHDADVTGPKEATEDVAPPLSPRPKADRPWTKDSNALSSIPWRKETIEDIAQTPVRPNRLDPLTEVETPGEEKKSSDEISFQTHSPSSLMRMAADSIHAVDYDKAVQGLQRRSVMDEDDDSLQSGGAAGSAIPAVVPPEFENAISGTITNETKSQLPIFGDPASFGAAGGEQVAEPPVKVADRARAIASWNGGLGVAKSISKVDHYPLPSDEIAPSLSPIRHEASDTEVDGMSPRISKRGFRLEDWKRSKSFDSRSEHETSSDFWQPHNVDHQVDDKDWSRCDPDLDGMYLTKSDHLSKEAVDVPVDANVFSTVTRRSTPPLLDKPKSDTGPRPKMTWRKNPLIPKSETIPPPQPTPKAQVETKQVASVHASNESKQARKTATFDPFDPFDYSFNGGEKVEFTEATDFTEGADFFNSLNHDPFTVDPVSFPVIQEQPIPTSELGKVLVAPPSGEEDVYGDEDVESLPNLASLAPPSGSNLSQYELWSYDADTSNLHEGAAEI